MFKKIAYISYSVQDMERAVKFYGGVLGLKLSFKGEVWSEFEIGGQRIALHKTHSPLPKAGGAVVSFEAKPIEDAMEKLKSRGVRFVDDLRVFPYGKLAVFLDSEGNLVGLYESPSQ